MAAVGPLVPPAQGNGFPPCRNAAQRPRGLSGAIHAQMPDAIRQRITKFGGSFIRQRITPLNGGRSRQFRHRLVAVPTCYRRSGATRVIDAGDQ